MNDTEKEFEEMYTDQAGVQGGVVRSYILPLGIKHLDEMFTFRIQSLVEDDMKYLRNKVWCRFPASSKEVGTYGNESGSGCRHEWNYYLDNDTPDIIEEEIKNNIHLHPKIKENLLHNLSNYRENWVGPRINLEKYPHY